MNQWNPEETPQVVTYRQDQHRSWLALNIPIFMSISQDTCLGFSKDPSLGDSSFEYHKYVPDLRHGEKSLKLF